MLQFSVELRNSRANQVPAVTGNAALLRIYSGALPANCAADATGALLSEHVCGTPFASDAVAGVVSPTLPSNVDALVTDTAGHWRLYKADGVSCTAQGTVGITGSGADMILSTLDLVEAAPVQVNSWAWSEAGA